MFEFGQFLGGLSPPNPPVATAWPYVRHESASINLIAQQLS